MHETAESTITLRRLLLVIALMFLLSFDPAVNPYNQRTEPVPVEYVIPLRYRRRRGRKRFREPLRFTSVESLYSLEGSIQHV